jgi:hypothetical protein
MDECLWSVWCYRQLGDLKGNSGLRETGLLVVISFEAWIRFDSRSKDWREKPFLMNGTFHLRLSPQQVEVALGTRPQDESKGNTQVKRPDREEDHEVNYSDAKVS